MKNRHEDQGATECCDDPAADVKRWCDLIPPSTADGLLSAFGGVSFDLLVDLTASPHRHSQKPDAGRDDARIKQDAACAFFLEGFALVLLEDILGFGERGGLERKGFHKACLTRADLVDGLGLFVALLEQDLKLHTSRFCGGFVPEAKNGVHVRELVLKGAHSIFEDLHAVGGGGQGDRIVDIASAHHIAEAAVVASEEKRRSFGVFERVNKFVDLGLDLLFFLIEMQTTKGRGRAFELVVLCGE